jgi:hypothetical protein
MFRLVNRCGIPTDLGVKQKFAILNSRESHTVFLSTPNYTTRFVYIAKHTFC